MRKLTETEEAICAASIENSLLMRRIIRLMPGGMPTLDYLEMLYAYATLRHRKSDLANVLLGATCYDVPHAGRDWFDWYLEIKLPGKAPDFFFLVQRYGWIRTKLELGNFAEEEDAEGTLLFLDLLKEVAGTGIIAFDDVVRQVRKIDKAQVEENEAEMREFIAAQKRKGGSQDDENE